MRKLIIVIVLASILPVAGAAVFCLYRLGRAAVALERAANSAEKITSAAEPEITATLTHARAAAERADKFSADTLTPELRAKVDDYFTKQAAAALATSNNGRKVADNFNELIKDVRPRVNHQLEELAGLTADARAQLNQNGDAARALLTDADGTLAELRARMADPAIARLLAGLADTSEQSAATLAELRATDAEVRAALPELLGNFNRLAGNSADLTGESAEFIRGLNKPRTKKQKIMRVLVQLAAAALPGLVQR